MDSAQLSPASGTPTPEPQRLPWLSFLLSDLRVAVRAAVRKPAFPLVVMGTLALGIGANTAMFSVIHAALLRPLPFPDAERLVVARSTRGANAWWLSSAPNYYDYREQSTSFEVMGVSKLWTMKSSVWGDGETPERITSNTISTDFFPTLGVTPIAGRAFAPDEGVAGAPYVVLISERFARRRYGSPAAAVGRTITTTGIAGQGVPATIVGVMPEVMPFPSPADLWAPMRRGVEDGPETRAYQNWLIVGRLKPGVTLEGAQRQVDVIARRLEQDHPATNRGRGLRLDPLQKALFGPQTPQLLLLMGAVGLVLLIACANVAGLLLARGAGRRHEMAMRAALGASRRRLVAQLLSESLLFTAVAGVAGVAVAIWMKRLLLTAAGLFDSGLSIRTLDLPVLLFAAAISAGAGLLFGIVPALRTSASGPAGALAAGSRATETRAGTRLRSLLVVAQVAASLALLVGAGALIRTFAQLVRTDVGFDARHLLFSEVALPYADPERRIQFYDRLREEVAALPGVDAVALTSHVPLRDQAGDPPVWNPERPPADASQQQSAMQRIVTPGFLSTMGIPLIAGRDLAKTDAAGAPRVLVINQLMARTLFPGQDPLGRYVMVDLGGTPTAFEVVGVAGDARIEAVAAATEMTMYVSVYQFSRPWLGVLVRTGQDPSVLTAAIRKLVASYDVSVPFESLVSLERLAGDSLRSDRVIAMMLGWFSAVALLLASLGLYGVLSYYVSQRTTEIGVRMALGADRATVLRHVLGRSGMIVIPGLVVGLGASLAGGQLLAKLFPSMPPADPATVVAATVTLALVAAAASVRPAWRAASIDPVEAIRGI